MPKNNLILYLAFILIFLPFVSFAQESTLYFFPASGSYRQGNTFWVSVMVNTSGKAINAVGAYFSYPEDNLEAVGIDTNGSILTLWIEKTASSGKVILTGGFQTPGFSGIKKIASIGFRVKVPSGSAVLSFDPTSAIVSDINNQNTMNFNGSGKGSYTFLPKLNPTPSPSPAPSDADPVISAVKAGDVTKNTAVVSWKTDIKANSTVEYGITKDDLSLASSSDALVNEHKVVLNNLMAGTFYHFGVKSKTVSGKESFIAGLNFSTLGYSAEIGFITDENKPAAGASVIIPGELKIAGVTDENGKVTLRNLPSGRVWISVRYNNSSSSYPLDIQADNAIQKFDLNISSPKAKSNIFPIMAILTVVLLIAAAAFFKKFLATYEEG